MREGNIETIQLEWFKPKEVTPQQLSWVLVKDEEDNVYYCMYIGDRYHPEGVFIRDNFVVVEWCYYPFKCNSRP